MLKYVCAVATPLLLSAAIQAQKSSSYQLKGHLEGVTGKVYLVNYGGLKPATDSTLASEGSFSFSGSLEAPDLYVLQFEKQQQRIGFFLEAGSMRIDGHKDSIAQVRFTGAPLQQEYAQWLQTWKGITAKAGSLYQKSDAAEKEMDTTKKAQLKKETSEGFARLDKQLYSAVDSFVQAHPASSVAAYIIYERFVAYTYPEQAATQYAKLSAAAQQSLYGKKIALSRSLEAKTAIGVRPAFTMADTANKPVRLADLKGKYVLVDFWASWCGPCRKENPNVVAAYQKYHDKGFEVMGVSLDSKKDAWLNAIHKDGLTWTHVSDLKGWENEVALQYGIKSVPTSFLVDRNGVIIGKNLRGEELQQKLASLLDK